MCNENNTLSLYIPGVFKQGSGNIMLGPVILRWTIESFHGRTAVRLVAPAMWDAYGSGATDQTFTGE